MTGQSRIQTLATQITQDIGRRHTKHKHTTQNIEKIPSQIGGETMCSQRVKTNRTSSLCGNRNRYQNMELRT